MGNAKRWCVDCTTEVKSASPREKRCARCRSLALAIRRVDSLEKRLAVAKADTERLNWLDRPWVKVMRFPLFYWMSDKTGVHPEYTGVMSPLSLRAAIDDAMKAD